MNLLTLTGETLNMENFIFCAVDLQLPKTKRCHLQITLDLIKDFWING